MHRRKYYCGPAHPRTLSSLYPLSTLNVTHVIKSFRPSLVSCPDPTPRREGSGDIRAFSWLYCVVGLIIGTTIPISYNIFYTCIHMDTLMHIRMYLLTQQRYHPLWRPIVQAEQHCSVSVEAELDLILYCSQSLDHTTIAHILICYTCT